MRIANSRNEAVISGNHHHSVGTAMPRSSHGIDAVDHHDEREEEQHEDRPSGGRSTSPSPAVALDPQKCASFSAFWS